MSTQLKFMRYHRVSTVPGFLLSARREINEDPNLVGNKQRGAGLIETQPAQIVRAHCFLCVWVQAHPSTTTTSSSWSSVDTEIEKPAPLLGRWLREIRKITCVSPS